MKIRKTVVSDSMVIALEGRLETTTAPELEKVIKSELDGIVSLTFDFSELEYISSAGLRILLSAQKIMNKQGKMKITGANEIVMEIFDITGFSELLTIE